MTQDDSRLTQNNTRVTQDDARMAQDDSRISVRSVDRQDPLLNILTSLQDTEAGYQGVDEDNTGTISECLHHQSEGE